MMKILHLKMKKFQAECELPSLGLTYGYLLKFALYYLLLEPNVHRYTRMIYELSGNRLPLPRPTVYEELIGEKPEKYTVRFSNVQSELGIRQLKKLKLNLAHRRGISSVYEHLLREKNLKRIVIPSHSNPSWVRYPIWVTNREEANWRFRKYGVLGIWFSSVLEEAVDPANVEYVDGSCPDAEEASKHLINLPNHPRVTEKDARLLFSIISDLVPPHDEERSVSYEGSIPFSHRMSEIIKEAD
jgi:hypothetical protein